MVRRNCLLDTATCIVCKCAVRPALWLGSSYAHKFISQFQVAAFHELCAEMFMLQRFQKACL